MNIKKHEVGLLACGRLVRMRSHKTQKGSMEQKHESGLVCRRVFCWLGFLAPCLLLVFVASGLASATSHVSPARIELENCRTEKRDAEAGLGNYKYLNFYVCEDPDSTGSGTAQHTSYVCIPFIPGTNDFRLYSLGPLEVTQLGQHSKQSRYPVPVYHSRALPSDGFETTSATVSCSNKWAFDSFAVVCDFAWDENRPSADKPLKIAGGGLDACFLEAVWPDPPPDPPDSTDPNGETGFPELPKGERFEDTIDCPPNDQDCGFLDTVNSFLSWMAFLVVPIVVIVIIVGGIQLSIAGDNPEATKKAKARITQAVVALIFYVLLWSVLHWLI